MAIVGSYYCGTSRHYCLSRAVEGIKTQLGSANLLSSPLQVAIDDGLLSLTVEEINGTDVVCRVNNTVMLGETKGINLPVTLGFRV